MRRALRLWLEQPMSMSRSKSGRTWFTRGRCGTLSSRRDARRWLRQRSVYETVGLDGSLGIISGHTERSARSPKADIQRREWMSDLDHKRNASNASD